MSTQLFTGFKALKIDHRHRDNLTPQQRSEIGRKGGEAVSKDHQHMAAIGKKGGENSHARKSL